MRLLVCGGRTFHQWKTVSTEIKKINPSVIITGGAPGADQLAEQYANVNGIPIVRYPALWSRGKKAGPERNAFMLKDSKPDAVLAFPGGPGTMDMVHKALCAGVLVFEVRVDHPNT